MSLENEIEKGECMPATLLCYVVVCEVKALF